MEPLTPSPAPAERNERLVTWHDTTPTRRAVAALDGLQVLRGQADRVYPLAPAAHLLNLTLDRAALGRVHLSYRPDRSHANEASTVDGGVIAALIEFALRSAVFSTLPAGFVLRTEEMNVHLVRDLPLNAAGLALEGVLVHGGPRLLTAEARLRDSSGELFAHGSATLSARPLAGDA